MGATCTCMQVAEFHHCLTNIFIPVYCDLITGASLTQPIPLSVSDCRGIVKTLVCGMKTITWGAGSCKIPGKVDFCKYDTRIDATWLGKGRQATNFYNVILSLSLSLSLSHTQTYTNSPIFLYDISFPANQTPKVFLPHETEQFVHLFRYGLVALDIYRVTTLPNGSYSLRSAK